ncbi:MAG: hypothetical protein Ct9H300mP19_05970 [Dehalococcoidia bacterium]|nr:MAG: hypothetical protein CM1200mP39_21860 [Dehalococcoidia bacterium]GIT58649.1 MAG: hypothetical protein Ct9H300mP19_05970 [Dehalococcoidia bacterium]
MPEWWIEATLPSAVFICLFLLWVLIPAPDGESDFASRLRDRFRK